MAKITTTIEHTIETPNIHVSWEEGTTSIYIREKDQGDTLDSMILEVTSLNYLIDALTELKAKVEALDV